MGNTDTTDEDEEMEYPMSVEAVGFSPSQPNWCATGGVDGKLKIWDLTRDGQCRQVCAPADANCGQHNANLVAPNSSLCVRGNHQWLCSSMGCPKWYTGTHTDGWFDSGSNQ